MFFETSDPQSIVDRVRSFIAKEKTISRQDCRQHATFFSAERFRSQFVAAVDEEVERFRAGDQAQALRRMIA